MSIFELLMIALGLSMDAFAAAICLGLSMPKLKIKHAIIVGGFFGGFQALMPLIGYLLGSQFTGYLAAFDHWIAFTLLSVIGVNMIRESRDGCDLVESFTLKKIFLLALATSIDALISGVSFAFMGVDILSTILIIGATTFIVSFTGTKAGSLFGDSLKSKAEVLGGATLILIGLKILLQDLFSL